MNQFNNISMTEIISEAEQLASRNVPSDVYGVSRGGIVPATIVASIYGTNILDNPETGCLIVDDLVDSGRTLTKFIEDGFKVDALFRKENSPTDIAPDAKVKKNWLVFPWEKEEETSSPTDAVTRLLQYIGEDVTRDGLLETPNRVTKSLKELTSGYNVDVASLFKTFENDENYHQPVVVRDIPFHSLCEHHMLPFTGVVHVAYLPSDRIIGLSKIARVVDAFAKRLQVQERMTNQIMNAINEHLQPEGVVVQVEAEHFCMSMRGVKKAGCKTITSNSIGSITEDYFHG